MEPKTLDQSLSLIASDFHYLNEGNDKVIVSYNGTHPDLQSTILTFFKREGTNPEKSEAKASSIQAQGSSSNDVIHLSILIMPSTLQK